MAKQYSVLTRIILWFSETDINLFEKMPQNVQQNRVALGLLVIVTGFFAFITSNFFVRVLFEDFDEITRQSQISLFGIIASILISLVWAFTIILIDKKIVSANSKFSALLRLPLAIAISFAISIPFKVMVFSDHINRELTQTGRVENSEFINQRNERIQNAEQRIKNIQERIDSERSQMAHWLQIMEAEDLGRRQAGRTGVAGRGPAYNLARENHELHKRFEAEYAEELKLLKDEYNDIVSRADNELRTLAINQSYDFVSQYKQLASIMRNDSDLNLLGNLLMILFLLIECIPAIMKLLKDTDEYDTMLKMRTTVSRQLITAAANYAMEEIAIGKITTHVLSQNHYPYSPKELIEQISKNLQ